MYKSKLKNHVNWKICLYISNKLARQLLNATNRNCKSLRKFLPMDSKKTFSLKHTCVFCLLGYSIILYHTCRKQQTELLPLSWSLEVPRLLPSLPPQRIAPIQANHLPLQQCMEIWHHCVQWHAECLHHPTERVIYTVDVIIITKQTATHTHTTHIHTHAHTHTHSYHTHAHTHTHSTHMHTRTLIAHTCTHVHSQHTADVIVITKQTATHTHTTHIHTHAHTHTHTTHTHTHSTHMHTHTHNQHHIIVWDGRVYLNIIWVATRGATYIEANT